MINALNFEVFRIFYINKQTAHNFQASNNLKLIIIKNTKKYARYYVQADINTRRWAARVQFLPFVRNMRFTTLRT